MLLNSLESPAFEIPGDMSDLGAAGGSEKLPDRNHLLQEETGFSLAPVLRFMWPLKEISTPNGVLKAPYRTWEVSSVTGKKEA